MKIAYFILFNIKYCVNLPSLLIPTAMHFFNRQYWHRFLFILKIEHCWFLVHGLYWIFCCMERRKNPCGLQRQLESRSGSELSSLEQPESVDSRRASNMLTNTECLSRNSVPHAIPDTIHNSQIPLTRHCHHGLTAFRAHYSVPTRMVADDELCGHCGGRRSYPRPTCRPPTQPRKWECSPPPHTSPLSHS